MKKGLFLQSAQLIARKAGPVSLKDAGGFACERILVNPPALSTDCPRLRVNEVRIESRWGSRQTKTQHGEA